MRLGGVLPIAWQEVRRFAPFLLGYLIAGVVLTALMLLLPEITVEGHENPVEPIVFILKSTLLILAPALAGVIVFSGGLEDRSAEFTASLPVSSTRVWMGKLIAGVILTGLMMGALLSTDILCLVGGISRVWFERVSIYLEVDILSLSAWTGLFLYLLLSSSLSAQLTRKALPAFFLCIAFALGSALIVEISRSSAVFSLFVRNPNFMVPRHADAVLTWLMAFVALPWLAFLSWHLFQRTRGHGNDLYARTVHGLIGLAGIVLMPIALFQFAAILKSPPSGTVGVFCILALFFICTGILLLAWGGLRRSKRCVRISVLIVVVPLLGALGLLLLLDSIACNRHEKYVEHHDAKAREFAEGLFPRVVFRGPALDEDGYVLIKQSLALLEAECERGEYSRREICRLRCEWEADKAVGTKVQEVLRIHRKALEVSDRAFRCQWWKPCPRREENPGLWARPLVYLKILRARLAQEDGRFEEAMVDVLEALALGHDFMTRTDTMSRICGNASQDIASWGMLHFVEANRGRLPLLTRFLAGCAKVTCRPRDLRAEVEANWLSLAGKYEREFEKAAWLPPWMLGKEASYIEDFGLKWPIDYHTHYTRYEMLVEWGKLDEYFSRLEDAALHLGPGGEWASPPSQDWGKVPIFGHEWHLPAAYFHSRETRPDQLHAALIASAACLHEARTGTLPRTLEEVCKLLPGLRASLPQWKDLFRYVVQKGSKGREKIRVVWNPPPNQQWPGSNKFMDWIFDWVHLTSSYSIVVR